MKQEIKKKTLLDSWWEGTADHTLISTAFRLYDSHWTLGASA